MVEKICDNSGIGDVYLYGGTRHSSALALRVLATPEQITLSIMTSTIKLLGDILELRLRTPEEFMNFLIAC